jgi:hypothetical protein
MSLRVALLFASAFAFTAFSVACETVEPQKEVTREVTKEVTVVQQPVEPKKGVKGEVKKEEVKKEEVKKEEVKKEEVKKEEPKYEDLPPAVKEKLPEEAKQGIKQKVPAEAQ